MRQNWTKSAVVAVFFFFNYWSMLLIIKGSKYTDTFEARFNFLLEKNATCFTDKNYYDVLCFYLYFL